MVRLHVLLDKHGEVLGTFRAFSPPTSHRTPTVGIRAKPDQQLVEVDLDDTHIRLAPDELHRHIRAHLSKK